MSIRPGLCPADHEDLQHADHIVGCLTKDTIADGQRQGRQAQSTIAPNFVGSGQDRERAFARAGFQRPRSASRSRRAQFIRSRGAARAAVTIMIIEPDVAGRDQAAQRIMNIVLAGPSRPSPTD